MRKSLIAITCAVTLLSACNKNDKYQKSNIGPSAQKGTSSLSVGQMHNIIINDWVNQYWDNWGTASTKSDYQEVAQQCMLVQEGQGWLPFSADEAVQNIMTEMSNMGIFNNDETVKSLDEITDIFVSQESDPALAEYYNSIIAYNGDPNGFIDYANDKYQAFSNSVTGISKEKLDNFNDVLINSFNGWTTMGARIPALPSLQNSIRIAIADAQGAAVGTVYGMVTAPADAPPEYYVSYVRSCASAFAAIASSNAALSTK